MNSTVPPNPGLQPREPNAPKIVNVLHSPKRVRVKFGGETIADSRETLLLRSNHFLPIYFFPTGAVRQEFLEPSDYRSQHELGGVATHSSVVVGDKRAENAAWTFADPVDPALGPLTGYTGFQWKAMDGWFEEDEELIVHPRDPYARIDTLHSTSHVQVLFDGKIIADSRRPVLLFETHLPTRFYIPREDIHLDRLVATDNISRCPYKGIASNWAGRLQDGSIRENVAWEYKNPLAEVSKIKGLFAFYPNAVDEIRLDGRLVV